MKIRKVDIEALSQMRAENFNNFISPMDDMYELGIIPSCDFYAIEDNQRIGYFALNKNNEMMQFYVQENKKEKTKKIFDFVISQKLIETAIPCSNDLTFYSLCDSKAKNKAEVYCMFIANEASKIETGVKNIMIDTKASIEDKDTILAYFKKVGVEGDWFVPYITQRIEQDELILFKIDENIIGSSELRPSVSSEKYANLGITISPDYRKRGLGSYFLSITIEMANDKGLKAICGVDKTNKASLRTVVKAGFLQYHSYMKMKF